MIKMVVEKPKVNLKVEKKEKSKSRYNYEVILRPRKKAFKVIVKKTKKKAENRTALYLLSLLFVGDFFFARGEVGTVVSPLKLESFLFELRNYWKRFKEIVSQMDIKEVKEVEDDS